MWVCCQLGAREHYSVPRALHAQKQLGMLVTDAWTSDRTFGRFVSSQRLKGRFHTDLSDANVVARNWSCQSFELGLRLRRRGWDRTIARNNWFQAKGLAEVRAFRDRHPGGNVVLFAYSYAARAILEFGRRQGWRTVLGQIDGGITEDRLVDEVHRGLDLPQRDSERPPSRYWDEWLEECSLADHIVVNSEWSRQCLTSQGVANAKLVTIPLAYEPPDAARFFHRDFPVRFTSERPLSVLFSRTGNRPKRRHGNS